MRKFTSNRRHRDGDPASINGGGLDICSLLLYFVNLEVHEKIEGWVRKHKVTNPTYSPTQHFSNTIIIIIIIIVTSFAPISSKSKLSGATKPGD